VKAKKSSRKDGNRNVKRDENRKEVEDE